MTKTYPALIALVLGITVAFILPAGGKTAAVLSQIAELTLSLGRYLTFPLIVFSLPVAVNQLRRLSKLGPLSVRILFSLVTSSAALTIIAAAVAWAAGVGRVPAAPGTFPNVEAAGLGEIIASILRFDISPFARREGALLLPLIVPAFVLGWHFYHDREIAEPSYNVFDSLSRLTYRANRCLLKILPGLLALITAYSVISLRTVIDFRRFLPLLFLLGALTITVIFVICPLALWRLGGRRSPWPILKSLTPVFLTAFISGSPLFNYGNLTVHLKEKLRIPRHTAALTAPLCLMFARCGTAMAAAVCMITIIRSYSSLEITLFQTAWTALFTFLISFALPSAPDRGLTTALILLGGFYGRGINDGSLILAPILPLLLMISSLLDTAAAAVIITIITHRTGLAPEEEAP